MKDGKRESRQSVDQSLQAWPLSGGIMLGARSQACCHAEAFTGTQRKIERCWQQVGCLIHPGTVSTQLSSLLQSEPAVPVAFRIHKPGLAVRLSITSIVSLEEESSCCFLYLISVFGLTSRTVTVVMTPRGGCLKELYLRPLPSR